ncbi:aminoglycoside phosphotransferase APH(3') [Paenibacillus sp. CCS19]|uniref:APH(3') family aminoglycoside O-phosphotransferase n=1 Tax=Paenibacillus sp. CCS19 TaxID=3158387 RepID=UPI0025662184|nr:APH(3') family aminoglycoside O-phosphotransferase [Paenibacillus cellulosilyticus]GMK37602.1 aminoglycoside phosphotransferase APH(3') [Paenibacillus cellulosilyticus]
MENIEQDLPIELQRLIGDDQVSFHWKNIAHTYFIKSKTGENKYLKVQPIDSIEPLDRQAKRLIWLQDKLPVPKVVDYGIIGSYEYLVTVEIAGAASYQINKEQRNDMVKLIAQGLRRLHEITIEGCPFDHSITQLMSIIRSNYDKGVIGTSDLFRKFSEDNLDKLIREVEDFARNLDEDLVFTHGDYSLPNIIVNGGCISGFIDLGNCGVADRYYDLAVAEKSIIRNFGEGYSDLFFNHYGIKNIDDKKIRFYQLVEHFVWT